MASNGLKRLRSLNGMKQQDVAEKLCMTVSNYAKIERNEVTLGVEYFGKLAEIFNVDVNTLEEVYNNKTQLKEAEFGLFDDLDGLDICYANFLDSDHIDSYKDLFNGFDHVRIITFSSSVRFIAKVIKECSFKSMEIIFGNKKVFDATEYLKELVMASNGIINVLTRNDPEFVESLKEKMAKGELKINIAQPNALSHEKLYVLWNDGDDNRTRVITGSANMSLKAYSGKQKENIIVFDDDKEAFDYFYQRFDDFLENTVAEVKPENLKEITPENMLSDNLIFNTVLQNNNTTYVEVADDKDIEDIDGCYIEDVEKNKTLMKEYSDSVNRCLTDIKATNKPLYILTPDKCRKVVDTYKLAQRKYKEHAMYYPEFYVAPDMQGYFNCEKYDCSYDEDNVRKDIRIFKDFFSGYYNGSFIGQFEESLDLAVEKYYASVIYGFISPFLHYCIRLSGVSIGTYSYPGYLILRGPKSAGKTPFCIFLLKLMFNQYELDVEEMSGLIRKADNVSPKEGLRPAMLSGKGFPVVIDELKRDKAKGYEGIIKDAGIFAHPCSSVLFTCNDDFEIPDYLVKRSVLFNLDISNNGSNNLKVNAAISNLNNLTGDLYKCFFSKFVEKFQLILEELYEIRHSSNTNGKDIPDVFRLGSEVLKDIFTIYGEDISACRYIKIYDSSFYRDGKSNLNERKKKLIEEFEYGDWKIDKNYKILYKIFDGFDGKSKAREYAEAMNQYGFIKAAGNKVLIKKIDWAKEFFDYDFVAHADDTVGQENIVEHVIEKEVIKEVPAEKPKGFVKKALWLFFEDKK